MPPVDRRGYLKYAGSATVAPLVASGDAVAAGDPGSWESGTEGADERVKGRPPTPTDLRVEYAKDPLGVETEQPRLSWRLEASQRGIEQSAYQVIVASGERNLTRGVGDEWDSGKVEAGQTTHVEYDGAPLESGGRVYWKVRVWDGNDRPSPWSETASWEMGLLEEDDWQGDWIAAEQRSRWYPEGSDDEDFERQWVNYTINVDFTLDEGPVGAVVRARDSFNCYLAQIDPRETTPVFRLRVRDRGQWSQLSEMPVGHVLEPGAGHSLRVTVSDDTIETEVDGYPVDRTNDDTHGRGRFGFHTPEDAEARVEQLEVMNPDEEILYEDDFSTPEETRINYAGGEFVDEGFRIGANGPLLVHVFRPHIAPGPLLRAERSLEKQVVDARAYVSGLGFYELYINGERVGEQVLDPGRTDYGETVLYATHDVTDLLQRGPNAIGVALGRARLGAVHPRDVDWNSAPWWSDPQLLLQLEVEFVDGTTRTITSGGDWRVTDGPTRFDELMIGEVYDARRERTGWTSPGYDDSDWDTARTVDAPDGEVTAQRIEPVETVDQIEPVDRTQPKPDVHVFDVGRMVAGWVELAVAGDRGADVTVTLGEQLNDDGTVEIPTNAGGPVGEHTYILNGTGEEQWEPRFTYHGFRYVQLEGEGVTGDPDSGDVTAKVVHTPVDQGVDSHLDTSADLFAQIHQNSRWALLNNYHSVPTDTPVYEKQGWTGDALLSAETAIYNFEPQRFNIKRLRDIRDEQKQNEDGALPEIAPAAKLGGTISGFAPSWQSEYHATVWWMYRYYGDERVLEEHYEGMKQYLEFVESHDLMVNDVAQGGAYGDWGAPYVGDTPVGDDEREDGSPSPEEQPVEWAERQGNPVIPLPPEGAAIVANAWLYRDAEILAETAEILGKPADAERFADLAESIRDGFNRQFLYPDDVYRTGQSPVYRQTSNVMPLAFGMVPEDREAAVVENLVRDVEVTHDGHLNTGFHGTKFLLPVLTEYGYHDVAYRIATQRSYPSWGWWIENGLTSTLEHWGLDARSRNHHQYGSIDVWFYQYLAGIREPAEPGFDHVELAPEPVGSLTWVEASTETPHGSLESRWKRADDEFALAVAVPGTATGTVRIPDLGADTVRVAEGDARIWEDGKATPPLPTGVEAVSRGDDAIVVEVGSGTYEFTLVPE